MSTKLGLHVAVGSRNGYGDVVARAPAVVIAVGEGGALQEASQKSGGRTITIFRDQTVYHDAPNGIDHMTLDQARHAADDNWPKLKAVYQLNPADYYQVTNETGGDNPQSLANIFAFETRLMELAEQDGFKLAIASPAGGSPGSWDLWVQFFVPHIRRAGQGSHIYSRHAYGGVVPGSSGFLTSVSAGQIMPADDNAGRPFREARFLRQLGILTPMVITEAGQNGGYEFPGTGPFMEDVERYDRLCQEHENIWGFCLWTYGNYQDRPANIQNVSAELADYLSSKGGASRPTYPDVIPSPITPRRVTHVIHLLPQDTTLSELKKLTIFLHADRTTFTYSADAAHALAHAGSGDSHVVVWSGSRWGGDIFAWLNQRGVSTVAREFGDIDTGASPGSPLHSAATVTAPAKVRHTVQLLPPDTSQAEIERLASSLHNNRSTFTYSADAAHALIHAGDQNSTVVVWSGQRWNGDIYAWLSERGISFTKDDLIAREDDGIGEEPLRPSAVTLEFGIHNEDGADWMRRNGVRGWGLHTVALGPNKTTIDCTHLEQAGIKMLVRLNYGYNPQGNIPLSTHGDYQAFIHACVETMRQSRGVWGYILGNETNNPHEWPGGPHGSPISAEAYVTLYNLIWNQKPDGTRLAPQAIDPYFGPGSDCRAYWLAMMNGIDGADFLTVHPKTQDSNPDNVDSDARFSDDPLRWQYLHLKSYQPLLAVVPSRLRQLPVIATEVNPQRKNDGSLGWEPGRGAEWVRRASAHFRTYNANTVPPVIGVIFYRFSADDWAISDQPAILDAISALAAAN